MAEGRDFVMARLAAARQHLQAATEAVDGCVSLFLFPADDKSGKDRREALDIASDAAGQASRAIENAESVFETLNKGELEEEEPENEDDAENDDEEDAAE